MESSLKKRCFKCGRELSLDCFYKHKGMLDGHLNKCRECTLLDGRMRREKHGESIRAYDRGRSGRPKKTPYSKSHPENRKAQYTLSSAIRDGRVTRSMFCERCWSPDKVHGHHTDYSKPLSVIWLCPSCHMKAHTLGRHDCSSVAARREF